MPSTLKSLKVLLRFSNELLRQSVIGLDATLKQRLVTDVSNALDTALLTGAGTSNTITGIIALASSGEVTPNRWFINGADFIELRKLKEQTGSAKYLLESDITSGPTYRLFGIPVTVTNKIAVGKAVLADTSQIAVARDLAPTVKLLDQRYAEYDEQAIRVVTRYDISLLHPEAVIVLTEPGS
jgi:hypothetical protein